MEDTKYNLGWSDDSQERVVAVADANGKFVFDDSHANSCLMDEIGQSERIPHYCDDAAKIKWPDLMVKDKAHQYDKSRCGNLLFLSWHIAYGLFWFRLFGYGLYIKDTDKRDLLYSERNGYRGTCIGKFLISIRKP